MADLLIKGMETPKNCFNCSTKINPDERRCNFDGHIFEETLSKITIRRDENCPLVEVPTHGCLDGWVSITDNNELLALRRESDGLREYIHIDKPRLTVAFYQEKFYFSGGELTPQEAEERRTESEFVRYSCKYGSWRYENLDVDKKTLQMVLNILNSLDKGV